MSGKLKNSVLLLFLVLILLVGSSIEAGSLPSEEKIKAAFLLKFSDYVQWPAPAVSAASAPVRIAIVGEDPFRGILPGEIPPTGFGNFGYVITRIEVESRAISTFQVLYFSETHGRKTANSLRDLQGKPILTVGEGREFLENGGIIAFQTENHRVRFLVNLENARRAGLKLSSNLLSLAARIFQ